MLIPACQQLGTYTKTLPEAAMPVGTACLLAGPKGSTAVTRGETSSKNSWDLWLRLLIALSDFNWVYCYFPSFKLIIICLTEENTSAISEPGFVGEIYCFTNLFFF